MTKQFNPIRFSLLFVAVLTSGAFVLAGQSARAQVPADVMRDANQGLTLLRQGDLDGSIKSFSAAIQSDPNNATWWTGRCLTYASKYGLESKPTADLKMLEQIRTACENDYIEARRLDPRFLNAYRKWAGGQAEVEVQELLKSVEAMAAVHFAAARLAMVKDKFQEGIVEFSRAIDLRPEEVLYWYTRGFWYRVTNQLDRAISDHEQVEKLYQANPANETLAAFRKLALRDRAIAYRDKGDLQRSLVDLTEAIRIDPDTEDNFLERARTHRQLKQKDQALADLADAIRLKRDLQPAYFERGAVYADNNENDKAINELTEAIRLKPTHAESHALRGIVLIRTGSVEKGIADLSEALKVAPNSPPVLFHRGIARHATGDLKGAITDLTAMIQYCEKLKVIPPELKVAYQKRADAYEKTGEQALAKADAARAKELGGAPPVNGDEIDKLIKDLKSPDPLVQSAAARGLLGKADVRALEPLMELYRSAPDKGVAWYTYQAIISIKDPRAVEPLIKHLQSGRWVAAAALGNIGDKRAVEPLLESLKVEGNARGFVIEALGKIRDSRAVDALLPFVENHDTPIREKSIQALGSIGDKRATSKLAEILLRDKDWYIRKEAAKALGEIGDTAATEALTQATRDSDVVVARLAGESLKKLRSKSDTGVRPADGSEPVNPEVDRLIGDLRSPEWQTRGNAASELAKLGDARAVEPLFVCLKEAAKQGRVEWKRMQGALLTIKDPRAVEVYIKYLNEGNTVAATALRKFPDDRAVDALVAVLKDTKFTGVYQFYWEAAESLGMLKNARAVAPLIASLNDPSEVVRFNVAKPLGPIGDRRAVEPLIGLLQKDPEYGVRLQAAISLSEIGDRKAVEPLITALGKDAHNYVRLQSANALGKLGDARATEALTAALADKDPEVQKAAQAALQLVKESRNAPTTIVSDPADGAKAVFPTLEVITVTFPSDMKTDTFTVVQATGARLPEGRGEDPFYFKDARTFVMQVKLEPDTAYAFSLNSARGKGFKLADGTALPPTVIRFQTSPARQVRKDPDRPQRDALVVSASGDAPFKTIAEAIAKANVGSVIKVRPGTYSEAIVFDKSLTVEGDGPANQIILESAAATCLLMKTTEKATVRGLTIRSTAASKNAKYFAIEVSQGFLVLEDCDITSDSLSGIVISRQGNAEIRRCKIHDCQQCGVFLLEKGKATIEDSEIVGNTFAGIETQTEGRPLVRKTSIHDGKKGGVFVNAGGEGVFEDCDIYGNTLANVEIASKGNSEFRKCKIRDGKHCGVFVLNDGAGLIEDCDVFGNTLPGIEMIKGGRPVVKNCRVYDNKGVGIYALEKGLGTVEGCEVSGNKLSNVVVASEANPTFRNCTIRDSKSAGLLVFEKGAGVFEKCIISGNTVTAVEVREESRPTLTGCSIRDGQKGGVLVTAQGAGTFEDCEISGNAAAGVETGTGGNPTLKKCRIHDNKGAGVYVLLKGSGLFEECDIAGNQWVNVGVASGGNPTFRKCDIRDSAQSGIFVFEKGTGLFEKCTIFGNTLGGVEIKDESEPAFTGCTIRDGKQAGVYVHNRGKGKFDGCDITGNKLAGIEIGAKGDPIFVNCRIHDNRQEGVLVRPEGAGTLDTCEIFKNSLKQVVTMPNSDLTTRNCQITENPIPVRNGNEPKPPLANGNGVETPRLKIVDFNKQPGRTAAERQAFEMIKRNNGDVTIDSGTPAKPVVVISLAFSDGLKDDDLALLKVFPDLLQLDLSNTGVTDAAMKHVKDFPSLAVLSLKHTKVTDQGLASLRDLDLVKIDLVDTAVTGDGLKHLKGMKNLEQLFLAGTKVDDAGLEHLKDLTEMKRLILNNLAVTDRGFKHLSEMTRLEELMASGTEVTDASLALLKNMPKLEKLDLSFTKITDEGLRYLKGLGKLRELQLIETAVTDAGLVNLRGMNQLELLSLTLTRVTKAGVRNLRTYLSRTAINTDFPDDQPARVTPRMLPDLGGPMSAREVRPVAHTDEEDLMSAARQGDLNAVRGLIDRGVSVDALDKDRATALMYAAVNGRMAVIQFLIEKKASLTIKDSLGWTPLHYAVSGNAEVTRYLLQKKADPNSVAKNGYTPLMNAAQLALPDAAAALLEAGADPNLKDASGLTAFDYAKRAVRGPKALPILEKWAERRHTPTRSPDSERPPASTGGDGQRIEYRNPIAGFQITIPHDWEMGTGVGFNTEIAIDAQSGAKLLAQPALWFFYSPNNPEVTARSLARAIQLTSRTEPTVRATTNRNEWEVTATVKHHVLGPVSARWLCRQDRGINYVIGAGVRTEVEARFREDIDTALSSCRLIDHPPVRVFHEPRERAYRILLPRNWEWEGSIIRTLDVPGYFSWKAKSKDGLMGCFTAPPQTFNITHDYISAKAAAEGLILQGLKDQVRNIKLERIHEFPRASAYFRDSIRLLGMNSRIEKVRADYTGTVNEVPVRISVDIVSVMHDQSRIPDPRLFGRGNWAILSSGAWAPVEGFDRLFPVARGVQVSLRTSPSWIVKQRETIDKVLAERLSVMEEAFNGWDAYIRDMERVPDPDGGPIQEVPNRDGSVWKDPDGIMWRIPPDAALEEHLKNEGWKRIR